MPSFLQRTTDAEGASKLKAQIEAAKAAGVAGPVLAAAEQKLKAFAVGEENRQRAQSERLRKETEKAELASPAGIARRAAEDQLRAVYPFPGMYADPAKLKPAIEAAKEAGVAAPIVAMAEAKLKEAEESPGRLVEAREKASSALESTAKTLQNFQDSVANWEMPNWDEGVTVTVGDTKVRGRGLSLLAMPVAASTLLDHLRRLALPQLATPRILGVDDWAKRRGYNYATILVDLEKSIIIDLLDGRTAEVLQAWLEQHPGVEVISRDRSGAYAKGAADGAAQAEQVADRWHLLHNLSETCKQRVIEPACGCKCPRHVC